MAGDGDDRDQIRDVDGAVDCARSILHNEREARRMSEVCANACPARFQGEPGSIARASSKAAAATIDAEPMD